jgi:hypothetical protein
MEIIITTNPCINCEKHSEVTVDFEAWAKWSAGALIQDAFPHFSPEERELLKSGTHPECWDALFGDDEEVEVEEVEVTIENIDEVIAQLPKR